MSSGEIKATVLPEQGIIVATFSSLGFIVFFALPAVMAASWESYNLKPRK